MTSTVQRKGVFYGWFMLAALFFALFMSTGARNGLGVFVVPMSNEFDWSRTTISLGVAVGWLVNGLTQPFLGRLYDLIGGRIVISVSLLVLGLCTILLSQTNGIWFFIIVYGVVMSIATGGASLVTIHSLLARWFRRRRGIALSISTAGASAGSLILVPFANYLILTSGWRVTWAVLGAIILLLAVPLVLVLVRNDPSDVGETQDGDSNTQEKSNQGRRSSVATSPLETRQWRESYASAPMWQMTGAYFVCGMTTAIISVHYVPFAIDRGISPSTAALAFGLMSGLNVIGVIGVGFMSDWMDRKYLLGAIYAVRGLAYAALILAPGALGIWSFAIIAGFSWIASAPLTSALTADIYGLRNMGTLSGMTTFAHQMGGALSIFGGGLLYDIFGAYDVPFAIAGSLLAGASVAAFSIKERKYSVRYQPRIVPPSGVAFGDGG